MGNDVKQIIRPTIVEGGFIYMLKQNIGNHTELLKLDLQFFAGEEDAILPDDYVAESDPFEEESTDLQEEQPFESEFETNESEDVEGNQEEQQLTPEQIRFKVKYNHEEQELGYDDAIPLIQKGMNYDKLQERIGQLESDPRLSFIEELANEQGMDVNEYLEAVKSAREDAELRQLVESNIPEEYAKEMLENRKFREQQKEEQQRKADEEKKNAEFNDFFQTFKDANDRDFDPSKDQIPQEVWDAHAQGTPLKFAYMQHHNQQLKSQLKTYKQNETNAKRAPVGSLTAFGSEEATSEDEFLKGFNSI